MTGVYHILDTQALREWEALLGMRINGDRVRVPPQLVEQYRMEIAAIQLAASFRQAGLTNPNRESI
jgi:Zn-dependent oligopeptidase